MQFIIVACQYMKIPCAKRADNPWCSGRWILTVQFIRLNIRPISQTVLIILFIQKKPAILCRVVFGKKTYTRACKNKLNFEIIFTNISMTCAILCFFLMQHHLDRYKNLRETVMYQRMRAHVLNMIIIFWKTFYFRYNHDSTVGTILRRKGNISVSFRRLERRLSNLFIVL